jgi:YHS domain-containing protein
VILLLFFLFQFEFYAYNLSKNKKEGAMAELKNLIDRVENEFSQGEEKIKKFQTEQVEAYKERQKRLEKLGQVFEKLKEIWRPRLEVLVRKFGDKVKVNPNLVPSMREAQFEFQSKLANISLKFSASTDFDVTKIILTYDLRIIPTLMNFDSHSKLELPLENPDPEKIAQWVDDRIISFIKTYQSLHENEYYLKDHMVEDPIIGVRFPKFAAGATLEWKGKTYYFVSNETQKEFQKQQGIQST